MQCLAERAMAWQDKAMTLLAEPELAAALRVEEGEGTAEEKRDAVEQSLAAETVQQLEDLMVEGNLLEVSLEEKHSIWQLLHANQSKKNKRNPKMEERQGRNLEDRPAEISAEENEARAEEVEEKAVDNEDVCSAKKPKCKYPTGKQVGWDHIVSGSLVQTGALCDTMRFIYPHTTLSIFLEPNITHNVRSGWSES